MRLRRLAIVPVLTLGIFAAGCGSDNANQKDVKGVPWRNPDKIEVYANIDEHPNIVRVCIDKVAFATTSRPDGINLMRVPEWDVTFCGAAAK
jgi:hypothetical protein